MAALDFPSAPTVGQQYAAPNGVTYQWDGAAWVVTGGPPGQLWTGAGGTLTPTDATKAVAVPGPTGAVDQAQILLGTRAVKSRLMSLPGLDWGGFTHNNSFNGSAWAHDDNTKPSWRIVIRDDLDQMTVERETPTPVTGTTPLRVQGSDGKTYCTLADASVTLTMLAPGVTVRQSTFATAPASGSMTGDSTWRSLCTTPAIITRAARVLLIMQYGATAIVGANTLFYYGFGMDGATASLIQQNFSVGAGLLLPPVYLFITGPLTAGSHTFSFWYWLNNGAAALSSAPGGIYAYELA